MSIRLYRRVWATVPLDGATLLLLLAIADHANDEGVCWPSVERLARLVRRSVRQTQRLMRQLESGGYIAVEQGTGRGKASIIHLLEPLDTAMGVEVMDDLPEPVLMDNERSGKGEEHRPFSPLEDDGRSQLNEEKGDAGDTFQVEMGVRSDTFSIQKGGGSDTLPTVKGDTSDTLSMEKGDSSDTLPNTKKVTSASQVAKSSAQKVTRSAPKGDIAPHAHGEVVKNQQQKQKQEGECSFTPTLFDGESDGAAVGTSENMNTPPKSPQQLYFEAICWIVGLDYQTLTKDQKGQVAQVMGVLQRAKYTLDELRIFWRTVWEQDWRWQKRRSRPTLDQLRSEIGKVRLSRATEMGQMNGGAQNPRGSNEREWTEEDRVLAGRLEEAQKRERLDPHRPIRERLDLSHLQRPGLGLPNE